MKCRLVVTLDGEGETRLYWFFKWLCLDYAERSESRDAVPPTYPGGPRYFVDERVSSVREAESIALFGRLTVYRLDAAIRAGYGSEHASNISDELDEAVSTEGSVCRALTDFSGD